MLDSEFPKISIAGEQDLESIFTLQKEAYIQEAEIYNDFNIPPLLQNIDSLKAEWAKAIFLKAEKNGIIVGAVRAELVGGVCKIGKLIVKPDLQNQGIGKRLMIEIEKYFSTCSVYELFTGNKSEKNLAVYRKLGYVAFKSEPVNDNLDLIYLRKINPLKSL